MLLQNVLRLAGTFVAQAGLWDLSVGCSHISVCLCVWQGQIADLKRQLDIKALTGLAMLPRNILNTYYVYVCVVSCVSYVFIFIHGLNPFKQVQATDYNNAPGSFSARAQEQCDVKRPRDQYKMSQMCFFAQEPNKSSLSGLKKNWSRRWVIVFHWSSVLQHWLPLVVVMREIHWFWFGCFALSMSQHVSAWLDTSIPSRPQFWTAFHLSIRFARSGSQGNWSAQSGTVQQDTFWISAFQLEASKHSSTCVLSIRMVLFCLLCFVALGHRNVLNGGIRPVLSPSLPGFPIWWWNDPWRHSGKTPRAVPQS